MLSESERLAAISVEAARRGTSYGMLVPQLTEKEQQRIYEEFEQAIKAKRERRELLMRKEQEREREMKTERKRKQMKNLK